MANTVTKGSYSNNETIIYNYLTTSLGLNSAAACGVLANIQNESAFNPRAVGDNGTSYGICQWHNSRYTSLKNYCSSKGTDYTSLVGQLDYLKYELQTYYPKVLSKLKSVPNSTQGAYDAGYYWCYNFEVPANYPSVSVTRGNLASSSYWPVYQGGATGGGAQTPSEDTFGGITGIGGGTAIGEDFSALTTIDEYASAIEANLSRVEADGFDYGYLIDLTHGGEFKFYIPDFSESAGANWDDVSIIGRSVSIKAYNNTASRSITVSLDLYAGAGLYDNSSSEDVVGDLHKDVYFIKSLEYPDYSAPIVRPPATVQLILGSAIQLVGVVSDVQVEHLKPLDSQNRSMYMKVSFKVTQTAVNPPDYSDIQNSKYAIVNPKRSNTMQYPSTKDNRSTNTPVFTKSPSYINFRKERADGNIPEEGEDPD